MKETMTRVEAALDAVAAAAFDPHYIGHSVNGQTGVVTFGGGAMRVCGGQLRWVLRPELRNLAHCADLHMAPIDLRGIEHQAGRIMAAYHAWYGGCH